ncbi:hypothetical protein EPUL_001198 [Erysiphe pulchra]|uniref:Uncharacterized protein n=1 Tax=Erysiphe pulchra TaxID=225359 RepID=A0A2S4PWA9_9PEZI|nr:hypothetical protein EPUL_001198 [Erysiphe pulchra]
MRAREALPGNNDDVFNNLPDYNLVTSINIGNNNGLTEEESTSINNEPERIEPEVKTTAPRRLPQWLEPLPNHRTVPVAYTSLARPQLQTCCKEDQVVLNEMPEPPAYLRCLWISDDCDAKAFRNNSRQMLVDGGIRGGLRSFSIHGQIYHQTSAAMQEGAVPRYAQLYFVGSEQAVEARIEGNNLNPDIVRSLIELIEQNNSFFEYYHTALRSLQESENQGSLRVVLNSELRLIVEEHNDRRRYNLPTTNEVAVVTPDGANRNPRDVILFARNGDGTLSLRSLEISDWIRTNDDRVQFCEFDFPAVNIPSRDTAIFNDRTILSSPNDTVERFNNEIAELRDAASREYFSHDEVQSQEIDNFHDYTPEFLRQITCQGIPMGILGLQVGMPVMLLRSY